MGNGDYSVKFNQDSRIPDVSGPYGFEFEAYSAGKAAALNAVEKWMVDNQPSFDLITVIPGWIFGRDELVTEAKQLEFGTTNSVLMGFLRGAKNENLANGNAVLGDEVAKVQVAALDPKIAGNQSFVTSHPMHWEDAHPVLQKSFSEALKSGKVSIEGKQPTVDISIDATKTEQTFGFKFSPFEDIVKSITNQYLELAA